MSRTCPGSQHEHTSCDTQLPDNVFGNIGTILYISGYQISRNDDTKPKSEINATIVFT
jgi:hypothetical protein